MKIRRVVTGVREGRSLFLADGEPCNAHEYFGWPGHATAVVWATPSVAPLPLMIKDQPHPGTIVAPQPGETRLMIVRFPPDTVFADPQFDSAEYAREAAVHLPGLIDCFEADGDGMHRTATIDYGVVLDGEIWLELDNQAQTRLRQGDVIVQGGARHAWRNKSDRATTMLFVLVGAQSAAV